MRRLLPSSSYFGGSPSVGLVADVDSSASSTAFRSPTTVVAIHSRKAFIVFFAAAEALALDTEILSSRFRQAKNS